MEKIVLLLTLLFCGPLLAAPNGASDPLYDELEGAALAEALVRDGKLEDARAVLKDLPGREARTPRTVKAWGELELASGRPAEAAAHFQRALEQGQAPLASELQLGLARAEQRLGRHEDCAKAAQRARALIFQSEADVLLKAGCERAGKMPSAAWETLVRGRQAGHGFGPVLEHLRLMLSLGLREEASRLAQEEISRGASSADALAMAEALMESGAREESLLALETARLRFSEDQDILLAVAPLYFAKGWKRATAEVFSLVAGRDPAYAEHAAETLRQAGSRQRSRYWNIFIAGEKERVRHKVALAVEGGRWDLVSSMDSLVKRSAWEGDDEVSYALAYSLLRGGGKERALAYLQSIRTSSLLGKVSALMKTITE